MIEFCLHLKLERRRIAVLILWIEDFSSSMNERLEFSKQSDFKSAFRNSKSANYSACFRERLRQTATNHNSPTARKGKV